jgi:hypothetical protein
VAATPAHDGRQAVRRRTRVQAALLRRRAAAHRRAVAARRRAAAARFAGALSSRAHHVTR